MAKQNLPPDPDDHKDNDPFLRHLKQLAKKKIEAHAIILNTLLENFEPIDYQALAFPEIIGYREALLNPDIKPEEKKAIQEKMSSLKLNHKHLLVLTVENVLSVAETYRWGLCKNHDFIYLYNGAYWSEVDREQFQKFLGEAAEKMGIQKYTARFYQFRDQLFKQFMATAYLTNPISEVDKVLINLVNGTFEITNSGNTLRPFNPADFLLYQLPFAYNPAAKAPLFESYLNRVLPDIERQNILAEFLGYVFIKNGSNTFKGEKALILYGTGANGKSVLFEIVNAMLGSENVSCFSLQSLTNENGYFRAKLANILVNYASEINGKLEASIFKQLVSGEPVEARLPYGQPFMLRQYAKLIFNCNDLPKDVEHTHAFFRRFLIIPFDVIIPESEQDKKLHSKIIESELSGIFNWVLAGLQRLLAQNSFSECDAARLAVEEYKMESNSIKLFLEERGYKGSVEHYTLIKELYPEYRLFCHNDGMTPFKKINFSKQLLALGFEIGREPGTGQKIVYITKDDTGESV